MMLTWLAIAATIVFAPSSLFAGSSHAMRPLVDVATVVAASQEDGLHVLLRVDASDVIARRLQIARSNIRSLLIDARIGFKGLAISGRTVQALITDPAQIGAAKVALKTVSDAIADSSVQEMILNDSESGLLKFNLTDAGLEHQISIAIARSIQVIRNRAEDLGATKVVVRPADRDGIYVQASGIADQQTFARVLTLRGRLSFQLVDLSMPVSDAISNRPPVGSMIVYTEQDPPVPYLVESRIILSDENVLDAQSTYKTQSEPAVVFRLDSKGTARFRRATTQNIGKPFAVILDDHVISAPVIREPIDSGYGQISGNFTVQKANDIALLLRTGALPARLTIAEEAR